MRDESDASPLAGNAADDAKPSHTPLKLSRRRLLGAASASIAGGTAGGVESMGARPTFEKLSEGNRVAYQVIEGGKTFSWVIERRSYIGEPTLEYEDGSHLQLRGGKLPGTTLGADLQVDAELRPGGTIRLRIAAMEFDAKADLADWLAGRARLRSPILVDRLVAQLGHLSELQLTGRGAAEFSPDGTLRIEAPGIVRATILDNDLKADVLTIRVPLFVDPELGDVPEVHLLAPPPLRRTLLLIQPGSARWSLEERLFQRLNGEPLLHWRQSASQVANPFDHIQVETGEDAQHRLMRALRASGDNSELEFVPTHAPKAETPPDSALLGEDGRPVRFQLRRPILTVTFQQAGDQNDRAELLADFVEGEQLWLHTSGCSLHVATINGEAGYRPVGSQERRGFRLEGSRGAGTPRVIRATHGSFSLQLASTTLHLLDAFVSPTRYSPPTLVQVAFGDAGEPLADHQARITVDPANSRCQVVLPLRAGEPPYTELHVGRPHDLLTLTFRITNFRFQTGPDLQTPETADAVLKVSRARVSSTKPRLTRLSRRDGQGRPVSSYLTVWFPPQHLAEQAIAEEDGDRGSRPEMRPPVVSAAAGESRLVFAVRPEREELVLEDLSTLLSWAEHTLAVQANGNSDPQAPTALETAIEAPYRIILSPPVDTTPAPGVGRSIAGWSHAIEPVSYPETSERTSAAFRSELWHTRLGIRRELPPAEASLGTQPNGRREPEGPRWEVEEGLPADRLLVALYSPDLYDPGRPPSPFFSKSVPTSLEPAQRAEIVRLTFGARRQPLDAAGQLPPPKGPFAPVVARQFMLSPLGAWTDMLYLRYPTPEGHFVSKWHHRMQMGRDSYVEIVEEGFLFPVMHAASLIIITERKFGPSASDPEHLGAFLRKRMFIVLRDRTKTYANRSFPFREVTLGPSPTPLLDQPRGSGDGTLRDGAVRTPASLTTGAPGTYGEGAFWPRVGGRDFLFTLTTVDWDGKEQRTQAPLVFVRQTIPRSEIEPDYNDPRNLPRRRLPLDGQKIAFARSVPGKPGETILETKEITLRAHMDDLAAFKPPLDAAAALFRPSDIIDAVGLKARLNAPDARLQRLVRRLRDQVPAALDILDGVNGAYGNDVGVIERFAQRLNTDFLTNGKFWNADDFKDIPLPPDIRALLSQPVLSAVDQRRLNRLLLAAAFPNEIGDFHRLGSSLVGGGEFRDLLAVRDLLLAKAEAGRQQLQQLLRLEKRAESDKRTAALLRLLREFDSEARRIGLAQALAQLERELAADLNRIIESGEFILAETVLTDTSLDFDAAVTTILERLKGREYEELRGLAETAEAALKRLLSEARSEVQNLRAEGLARLNRWVVDLIFQDLLHPVNGQSAVMQNAAVILPAVQQLLKPIEDVIPTVRYYGDFAQRGFDAVANPGEVFAELTEQFKEKLKGSFPRDRFSGIAGPDMDIAGLSRRFGAVAGELEKLATGKFDPLSFFNDSAKILGVLPLKDLVSAVFGDLEIPKLNSVPVFPELPTGLPDLTRPPRYIESRFNWQPEVKDFAIFKVEGDRKDTLTMEVYTQTWLASLETKYRVDIALKKFVIDLHVLRVHFERLRFLSQSGERVQVDPQVTAVDFEGPLKFVKNLQDALSGLFGDGFHLDIQPVGIVLGLSLEIPPIALGAVSLRGISINTQLELPFADKPIRFRFAFGERHNPFIVGVGIFGGTGFFAVGLRTGAAIGGPGDLLDPSKSIEIIEAQIEFGGYAAFEIAVASGEVHLFAGIYFRWLRKENGGADVELTAFVRVGGHVSVLSLITVSAEFILAMSYFPQQNVLRGKASLVVKIEIFFFDVEVTLEVERTIAGSGSDAQFADASGLPHLPGDQPKPPRVEDVMSAAHFRRYWSAFDPQALRRHAASHR